MSKRVLYAVVSAAVVVAVGTTMLVVLRDKQGFEPIPEFAEARESGKPVEVMGQRTEVQQTWANPNGTFKREYSAYPKWVKDSDGWKPIDYTLVAGPKGTLRPKAAPNDVVLSGGGDKFLMSMTTEGVETSLSWPAELPRPTVDGATATYADVVPDVDLKMTVTDAGPSQILVVKNSRAAANPSLTRFKLGATVKKGSMGEEAGGLRVLDQKGRVVARAPRPQMWDSSGKVVNMKFQPLTGAAADQARVLGPGRGDRVAAIKLDVDDDGLVLAPNQDLLQGADVEYPVFIDPMFGPPKFDWAMVRQQSPSTVYYKWSNSDNAHGVGYDGGYKQRLFWKFEVADLAGANLSKATFVATARGSVGCGTHYLNLYRTNQITPSTNWNNQPSVIGSQQSQRNGATGSSCTYKSKPMEFAAEPATQAAVNANVNPTDGPVKLTLRLTADSESSASSWVWVDKDATLSIVYAFAPSKPTGLALADPSAACGTFASTAGTIGGLKPRVSANLTGLDLDKDNVKLEFQAFPGGTIEAEELPFWTEDSGDTGSKAGATVSVNGSEFVSATRVQNEDAALPAGYYVWRARAVKANDSSNVGPWSSPCVFKVSDAVVPTPGVAPVSSGAVWQVDDPVDVRFSPTDLVGAPVPANVASYRWSLNSTSASKLAPILASQVTKQVDVPITPDRAGFNVLRVWGYDVHGNRSVPKVYTFDTTSGAGVFGARYLLNEEPDSAAVLKDAVGTNHLTAPGTMLADRGSYRLETTPGLVADKLLHFTATDAPAQSTSTAVDTTKAFTVSAWVDPQAPTTDMVALSQGTTTQSVFTLGTGPCATSGSTVKCYRFGVRGGSGYTYVTSSRTVIQDGVGFERRLVHLVGSVSKTGKARLYVFADGTLDQTSGNVSAPTVASNGKLVIGADRAASAFTSKWVGNIDMITVMAGALDAPGAVQLHALDDERCYESRTTNDDGLTLCE